MNNMEEHQNLPDANQLSVLASMILLAYALTPFFKIGGREYSLELPGIVLLFQLNLATVVPILVAALAAVGTDWLLRRHPRLGRQATFQHWILPALTAWVIGVPLNTLGVGRQWWVVFAFGSALLILVLVAEYIVVDPSDVHYAPATVGLTAVSFALFLILAIALRAAAIRLYLLVPALVGAMALVSLRTLYLRLGGQWKIAWALGMAVVVGQFAAGLHYWPLSPLTFGLALLGPAYALTSLAAAIEEGRPRQTLWIEPAVMLTVLWGFALILGS